MSNNIKTRRLGYPKFSDFTLQYVTFQMKSLQIVKNEIHFLVKLLQELTSDRAGAPKGFGSRRAPFKSAILKNIN